MLRPLSGGMPVIRLSRRCTRFHSPPDCRTHRGPGDGFPIRVFKITCTFDFIFGPPPIAFTNGLHSVTCMPFCMSGICACLGADVTTHTWMRRTLAIYGMPVRSVNVVSLYSPLMCPIGHCPATLGTGVSLLYSFWYLHISPPSFSRSTMPAGRRLLGGASGASACCPRGRRED